MPWQVQQTIVETWDKFMDDAELLPWAKARFRDHPPFENQAEFKARWVPKLRQPDGDDRRPICPLVP